jgi:hypothetical protein
VQLLDDLFVLALGKTRERSKSPAQDGARQQIAVVLDVRLSQRRTHAVPERDQRQVRMLSPRDVRELLDVGGHVIPGGDAGLPKLVGTCGLAMSAQVEGVGDATMCGEEPGQPVVPSTVFGYAVGDLHHGVRPDAARRLPLADEDRGLIDLRFKCE